MSERVGQLLELFDTLPEPDQRAAVVAILKRRPAALSFTAHQAEQRPACRCLRRAAATAWLPITFDAELNEYNFEWHRTPRDQGTGGGVKESLRIRHCPFCGREAPESRRPQLFAAIPSEEERRLQRLTVAIRSVEDAIRVLGTPDCDDLQGVTEEEWHDNGAPPTRRSYRRLTYSRLSGVAEVLVTDYQENGLRIELHGKYVGRSAARPAEPQDGS